MTPEERRRYESLQAHYDQLAETLKGYELDEVLALVADRFNDEAARLEQLGYPDSAAELERLANILGCLNVPGLPTAQERR